MRIRDDRGLVAMPGPSGIPTGFNGPPVLADRRPGYAAKYAPDAVLYDCPDCGRSHFVTVDSCPNAATAAAETARADRKAA